MDLQADLEAAVEAGDEGALRALLAAEGGAPRSLNVDARDVFQAPLICRAARSGHSGVVRVLVEAGADATAMNYGDLRKTAIHYAVLRSDLLTIEALLDGMEASGKEFNDELLKEGVFGPERAFPALGLMAITRPRWTPGTHAKFPPAMREAAKMFAQVARRGGLADDLVCLIVGLSAYPLSAWTCNL